MLQVFFNRPNRVVPIHELINDIDEAEERLVLASAWFTDYTIAQTIIDSPAKTKIIILNKSDIKRGEKEAYTRIQNCQQILSHKDGSRLIILGADSWEQGVMHHKFCLIDYDIVWTGSFNFTFQARRNYETLFHMKDEHINQQFWQEVMSIALEDDRSNHLIHDTEEIDQCYVCKNAFTVQFLTYEYEGMICDSCLHTRDMD